MTVYAIGATALTGGAEGALDAEYAGELADEYPAIVFVKGTGVYFYIANATSGAAENSPLIIKPDWESEGVAYTGDLRWELVGIKPLSAANIYSGTDTFNGSTGVVCSIGATLAGTTYRVAVTITSADPVDVGAISVEGKTTTQFTVKCTGSDTTETFDWILVDAN